MKALQYRKSIPRYAVLKLFGRRFPSLYTSSMPPVSLVDIDPQPLPTPQWLRIAPHLTGICGSDLSTICAKGSPYLAPLTSMPFVLGHEVVGHVEETGADAGDFEVGDRVVIHPALGCRTRGIEPLCPACRAGRDALCRNVTRGDISAGIQTGFCRDTGGGFSESLVAHRSQVYKVPDEIDDRAAVLIEPFACAIHGALRVELTSDDTVLVIGCGAIGLLTIAALRATGCPAKIVAVARYDHQRALATSLGADHLLDGRGEVNERYRAWADVLDAETFKPELGKPTVIGGAAAVFDCVATSQSLDDAIRFTRSAGTLVLIGMPGVPRHVDWTPLWFKELTVHAAYAYGPERYAPERNVTMPAGTTAVASNVGGDRAVQTLETKDDHASSHAAGSGHGRETFDIALDLIRDWGPRLATLLGEPYPLADYRAALRSAMLTSQSRVAKTAIAVHDGRY